MGVDLASSGDIKHQLPHFTRSHVPAQRQRRFGPLAALLSVLCMGYWLMSSCAHYPHVTIVTTSPEVDLPINVPERIQRSWAMYSPWHSRGDYPQPPLGCEVTQVNLLQRHGSRQPSGKDGDEYHDAVKKLLKVKKKISKHSSLGFIKDYKYTMTHDDLVELGAKQSRKLGSIDSKRYSKLVDESMLPFVRASGASRVVDTAWNWTTAFSHSSHLPVNVSVVISESRNNTLDNDMCPKAGDGDHHMLTWLAEFAPPIIKRLKDEAPGADLSLWDIYHLMAICPIETQVLQRASPFCAVFDEDEWVSFEYTGDLEKFYKTGYGEPLGPVQGVGYVNELLARLTGSPVRDRTQVNHTLDSDPHTFPLNRTFYADFTHENSIIAIFAAMGLFRDENPLDPLLPDPSRQWVASSLVPFSARMVTERLHCAASRTRQEGEYIRILINEALEGLECADGAADGMCTLNAFVESQAFARSNGGGDFEKCGYEVEDV